MTLINIKKGLAAAVATSLLALSVSAPVNAAVGTTAVTVDINPFIILYTFDEIEFDIQGAELAGYLDTAAGSQTDVVCNTNDLCVTDSTTPNNLGDLTIGSPLDAAIATTAINAAALPVVINNAYGIRSIASSISVTILPPATLAGTTGTIAIANTGTGTDQTFAGGLTLETASLEFTMDMANAVSAGDYVGTWTITVTGT
jgi:hypothetical protein